MNVDWSHFTPGMSLLGGVLLGLASAVFVLMNGRILGISGILGGLLRAARGDRGWRLAFLAGLFLAPSLAQGLAQFWPALFVMQAPRIDAGWGALVVAGLLVGTGTRYAAGCTSGHGVCGLSRLSPRSLVATLTFMSAGFVTVYLLRHVWGVSA